LDFYMSPIIFNIKNLFTALNERTITESEHVNAFSFRSVNEAEAVRKTEARESAEGIIAEEAVRKTEARESAEGRIAAEAIRDAAASRMYEENRMKKFNKRIYNRMIQAGIPESAVIQFRLLSIANEIIKTLPFSSVAERVNLLNGSMWSGSLVLEIFGKRVYSKDERPSGHEVTHLFSETVLLKHPIIKVLRYGILNARFFAKHAGFVNNLFSSLANEGVMEKPFKTDTPYQIHERVGQVLIEASSLAQAKGIYFGVNFDSKNESIVLSRDISKCRNSLETLRSYLNDGIRGRQIPVRSESGFALKQGAAMLNMFILNFERFEAGLTDEGGNILQY